MSYQARVKYRNTNEAIIVYTNHHCIKWIYIFLFLYLGKFNAQAITGSSKDERWTLSQDTWDIHLLRTNPTYLVEGKGGLCILLGDRYHTIINRWGQPSYRDYGKPEKIFYHKKTWQGYFIINGGKVKKIVYYVPEKLTNNLFWNTAIGIDGLKLNGNLSNVKNEIIQIYQTFDEQEQKKILSPFNLLADPLSFIDLTSELNIYSRGIRFIFSKKRIQEIHIFRPYYLTLPNP